MMNSGKPGGLTGLVANMQKAENQLAKRVAARQAAAVESDESENAVNFEPKQPEVVTYFENTGKPDQVPSLNLHSLGGKAQKKTQYELDLEKQVAAQKIDGPSDKPWENFGVNEANDFDQMIKLDKTLKPEAQLSIKETVDRQMHDLIIKKRAWAYYDKHQPDFQAFETDIKKIIVRLISPCVQDNTKNGLKIEKSQMEHEKLERRLNDLEFVYKRTAKNASAQQDALQQLETRSKALQITEQRLVEQVKQCETIKSKLEEKFKVLRDDRETTFLRLDHVDNELNQYRTDIRQMHDQVSASVFDKVREANTRSLTNEKMFETVKMKSDAVLNRFDALVEGDFREQAILVGKLQENYIEQRRAITQLDKAIVTKFDWEDKNRNYDHQINLLMAKNNTLTFEHESMNKYLTGVHKTEVQEQIDSTMQAVFGNRKKFMKQLKSYQDNFYDNLGKTDALGNKVKRSSIIVNSDEDSDDSISRLRKLQAQQNDMLGANGNNINSNQLMQILKQHEDEKLTKVRDKYLKKMPLRRCSRYKENKSYEFLQDKLSQLRQLTNKQQQEMSSKSQYKHLHIQLDRRLSTSLSNSSLQRGHSQKSKRSGFSINRTKRGPLISLEKTPELPVKPILPPMLITGENNKNEKTTDYESFFNDQNKLKNTFSMLKDRLKLQIAEEINTMLDKTNKKYPNMKLLKVKQSTIQGALDAFKDNRDYQMTRLEIAAIAQVLTMKEVKNEKGHPVQIKELVLFQDKIIMQIVDYEYQHRGESSSDRSSKASRRVDVLMQPPVIAIEPQASNRSHIRSKTVLLAARQSPVLDHESASSSTSMAYSIKGTGLRLKQLAGLTDLKSVKDSDKDGKDDEPSSESLRTSSHRQVKLALQQRQKPQQQDSKSSTSMLQEDEESQPVSPISDTYGLIGSAQMSKKQSKDESSKVEHRKKSIRIRQRPSTAGDARGQISVVPAVAQTGEEVSFDFPEDTGTVAESGTAKGRSDHIKEEDLGLLPDGIDIPDTDHILEKMKDQMDELEQKLMDRTNELREVQKYLKRLEQSIIAELVRRFEYVFNMMNHDKADMSLHLQSRMDIVGDRFVRVNKKMAANADCGSQDLVAIKRRIKLFGRRVDSRMDEVNVQHDHIMSKYNYLLTCNNYIGQLAHTVIDVVELNSCLIRADERDKRSICLMGSKGHQTVHEKNTEMHMMRLKQQVDDLEQSEVERTGLPVPQQAQLSSIMRPASGISHFSQKSGAQTMLSQVSHKSKFGHVGGEDQYPVIQIDKRCHSCSDNKGQLLHLFKIACLSYFPGQVDYKGKKLAKKVLMQTQDDFVEELKRLLDQSGVNKDQTVQIKDRTVKGDNRCDDLGSQADSEDAEEEQLTQVNSDLNLTTAALSDAAALSKKLNQEPSIQLESNESTDRERNYQADESPKRKGLPQMKVETNTLSRQQLPPQSSLKNFPRPILSVNQKQIQSPDPNEILSEQDKGAASKVGKLNSLSNLNEYNEAEMSTGNLRSHNNRITKGQRVSFDKGYPPMPLLSQASGSALKKKQGQQLITPKLDPTQTSFRFNCTHELLAFNQDQVSQIVANSMHENKNQPGEWAPDQKLLQIQKLKEKALLIKMSREVNKPNKFAAQLNDQSNSPNFRGQSALTPAISDIFPTRDQVEHAQNIARRKHQKETQMMIETRERFTKRYQFEKLSHQVMETPTETQFSGSAHNELARYDSKTIFRQAHRQQPTDIGKPQTYAHLMQIESTSLPKLTRNYSAAFNTGRNANTFPFAVEEASTTDAAGPSGRSKNSRPKRNQRPISSMNEMQSRGKQAQAAFWKTAKRNDGRSVVIMNRQRLRDLEWSRPRESTGTDQFTQQMRGGEGALSLDNILLSNQDE